MILKKCRGLALMLYKGPAARLFVDCWIECLQVEDS